ncbi:glycosyltransferase [[Clostridium] symbiosum]|uniref:Glycosyltransferase n=1 Tax=Clostridium symbiosum TaxID=1512 RepID=A0AAW5F2T5_CLOSY|nr:glycosyltransferase [[Clostridium] symbiosum]MCK0086591.1 glycosyltransferase [[Clostridium] symbiosum]
MKKQGEYILFLDSDDYITDKCFEQATGIINTYRPDIVIGYTYRDLSDEGKKNIRRLMKVPRNWYLMMKRKWLYS